MAVKTLLVLLAVVLILRAAIPLLTLHQLLRMPVWKYRERLIEVARVPAYVREAFAGAIASLEALGFQQAGWIALEREHPSDDARFRALLFHAESAAYASVAFSSAPDSVVPLHVGFVSVLADDRVVRTFDGSEQAILGEPPGTVCNAPYAITVPDQWQSHQSVVRATGVVPLSLDANTLVERMVSRAHENFDAHVRDGALLRSGDAHVLSWRCALRGTRMLLAARPRLRTQRATRTRLAQAKLQQLPVLPIEAEVAAYKRQVVLTTRQQRASFYLALLAVTVPLFILGGWYSLGAATTAVMILGIVLFHEAGHYLAMRALGYVDTTIFFVPFLGGIASGRKDDATLAQRMIVLLAGPVPGLTLAIGLALGHVPQRFAGSPWLAQGLLLLVIINLFNLLPLLPLDGGQIAHMLLFARHPWLDVASRAAAGVGLLLVAWATSGVFIGVLGVFILLQLARSSRQAVLRRRFHEASEQWPDESPERLVFRVMQAGGLGATPFAQKFVMARTVLTQVNTFKGPAWAAVVGWLAAYGSAFALGCVAVAASFSGTSQREADGGRSAPALRTEFVASLPCPAGDWTTSPAATAAPPALLRQVVAFDAPEAALAGKTRIEQAAPHTVVTPFLTTLFVWRQFGEDTADDDVQPEAMEESANRLAGAARAAGGRVHQGSPDIACTAPDETTALSIEESLGDYYAIRSTMEMTIPPPWEESAQSMGEQALARHTFRVAEVAEIDAMQHPPPSEGHWWAFITNGRKAARDYVEALRKARVAAVERALAAERTKGSIDEDVARLVVARTRNLPSVERSRVEDELREKLGAVRVPRPAGSAGAKVVREGTVVRAELGPVMLGTFDAEMRPLLGWFCSRGCRNPQLLVTTRLP